MNLRYKMYYKLNEVKEISGFENYIVFFPN